MAIFEITRSLFIRETFTVKNGNYYFRILFARMENGKVSSWSCSIHLYAKVEIYIYIRIELKGRKGRRGTSKDERECTSVSCLVIVRAPRGMNPLVGPRRQLASTLRYPDTGSNKPRGTKISHGDPWTPLLPPNLSPTDIFGCILPAYLTSQIPPFSFQFLQLPKNNTSKSRFSLSR